MLFGLKKFISFWLMPLPFCLTAMLIGLTLMRSPRRRRLGRALLLSGLVLLMLLSNKFVSKWLIDPLQQRYPAIPEITAQTPIPAELAACRYVVVLGAGNGYAPGVSASNLLSSSGLARITEAVRLLRVLPDAKLLVSGPGPKSRATHAVVLARAAAGLGIPLNRVEYIDQARDTEEESRAVQRIVQGAPVALVTSAWHMPRSMALFRSTGLNPVPCPCDYRSHVDDEFMFDDLLWDIDSLGRSSLAVRERIGYLWIWLRGKT